MLEILCRILFFLSMLVLYVNVSSTSIVILIVLGYIVCVFIYYYFNNVRCAIDECYNYCNFNATKFSDSVNPSQVSGYFVNRKYNKMSNNGIGQLGGKKLFGPLCSPDGGFTKENSLFDSVGTSVIKSDFKNGGELPSPILKTCNLSLRGHKLPKDKLKIAFSPNDIVRQNGPAIGSFNPTRRHNANLDMETYMNVNSPGFTSRVVDKAAESASYHVKYPAVRQVSSYRFDKSVLRHLSKIPRVNSATTAAAAVRIAPPEVVSMNLSSNERTVNGDVHDSSKNGNILQVLKDMSRKRNYTQEESDRSGSTPKKSRKNEMRNVSTTSQYKRAHEDSPNDNSDDNKCRKKRCDDTDRDIVKMMSYTSGLSVQGFTWENQSKKRKSSKLEKSRNDSPEKLEKFRKISEECVEETMKESVPNEVPITEEKFTIESNHHESEKLSQVSVDATSNHVEETDNKKKQLVPFIDEDEDEVYVCVAAGKILNRTNCPLRKKLKSRKIDPVSVISTKPEYVNERTHYVDDKVMKENLLNSLVNNVERKEEKCDNVIFYQNSIFEEMANKVVVEVEVHQPRTRIQTASTMKPLQPPTVKPTLPFNTSVTTAEASTTGKPTVESSKALPNEPAQFTNPLLEKQSVGFTFDGKPFDVVDSPKTVDKSPSVAQSSKPVEQISTSTLAFSTPLTGNITALTVNAVKPAIVSSPVATTKPTAEEQKSPALFPPVTLSATPSTPTSSSNASTSQTTNPLLSQTPSGTPGLVAFNKPAVDTTGNTSTAPKISMFENTAIASSSSSNMFATSVTTAPTASSFASTVQSTSSTTGPSFAFGQTAAPADPSFDLSSNASSEQNGFKFGTSQPTVTTASFNVKSPPVTASSVFTTTASPSFGSCFSTTTANSFTTDKPPMFASASNSTTSSFTFGAQTSNGFGSTNAFNGAPVQPAPVFGSLPTTTASQPSVFGATNTQSLSFGASVQSPSTSVFGASTPQTQSSVFGASYQSPVFGQSSSPASAAPTIFGNTSQTVGGGDGGSVFGKPSQDAITNTPSSQFVFGASNQSTAPASTTFGAAAPAFGNGVGGQLAFGTNGAVAAVPTFNFSAGTSNFGSNAGSTGSPFAAASNGQPGGNSMFSFGSNINAAPAVAPQSTFQFRPAMPSQPNQPFMFGGGVPASTPTAGGFSIGSGGSGAGSRNRAIARPRKAK